MNDRSPAGTDLTERVDRLELEQKIGRVASGYARFYAAMAVFSLLITLIPLHRRLDPDDTPWPNLWGLNLNNGSVQAGIVLIIAEVVVLAIAAYVAPRGRLLPILVALLAVPEVLILISHVGVPDDAELSAAGTIAIIVGIVGIVVSIVAAVHVPRTARIVNPAVAVAG